ncbi:hydrogen gas-evolving membrane-bound hydrogenase subunit E, partial [Hansschlegelia beijingensis]|uniref:hydrogen gas-evolving membrane-bound hydrogenase subunit E n=1 Tax=Hansschlegelia beijingensis TaxID=1133344 RepID=UPI00387F10E6
PALEAAVRAALGAPPPPYSLAVWHGFNFEFYMSVVALAGGAATYVLLRPYLLRGLDGPPLLRELSGRRIFDRVLVTLSWRLARWLEGVLGTRRLQPQLQWLTIVAVTAAAAALFAVGLSVGHGPSSGPDLPFALLWVVGVACAVGAASQAKYHRVTALILLGGAGLVTCVTFVWLSAPDLALTQLVVETVTTVLLLLGVRWLPKRFEAAELNGEGGRVIRWYRVRDLLISLAVGGGLAALAYAAMTRPAPDSISRFFVENAYLKGGGTNIVNVILVDFRGFDTLGEITVLGVVALTVFALLRRFRPAPDSIPVPEQQRTQSLYDESTPEREKGAIVRDAMAVPALIMRLLFPVVGTMAVFLLLRGHDLPGGGFVAGITMAVAFLLQYMALGTAQAEERLHVLPVRWIGVGLLLATGTGAASWLFGRPFLTSYFGYADLPLIGKMPTASAFVFDLGVFSLVVGATVLMLIALAHQSVRSHRIAAEQEAETPATAAGDAR